MPIDPGIYERRPVRSVAEITNALLANDRAGLENGLMAQKADEYRRGVADDAQMRDLVRASGGDPAALRTALVQRGDVKALDAHDKGQMELAKGSVEIGFKGAQTQEHQAGADVKRIQAMRDGAAYAAQGLAKVNAQDDASIVDWYKDAVTKGLIKSEDAIAEINKVPPAGPAREQWKAQQQQAGMTMIEQANKQLEGQRNAETNRSNVARETETGRHNRNTEGLTARGQNITRDVALQGGTVQVGEGGNLVMVPNKFTPGQPVQSSPVVGNAGAPVTRGAALKDIPPAVQTKIIEGKQGLRNLDAAIAAVEATPDALGISNAIPGAQAIKQLWASDDEIGTRGKVANIGSLKLHDRSGANVTVSEQPRLVPFIPSPSDTPKAAAQKLREMKRIAEEELGLYAEAYGEGTGYKPSTMLQPKAATNAASGMPDMSAIDAEIRRRNGGK